MRRWWIRFNPDTREAELEDEEGVELPTESLTVEYDGNLILIGPLDLVSDEGDA